MKRITGKSILSILFLVCLLQGGIGDDSFSFILEGRSGLFRPAPKNFSKIYGNDDLLSGATMGVGYKNAFVIARYKLFRAKGNSIVKGVGLQGVANWRQEFISLGIRSYVRKWIYAELAYTVASVKESISTDEPLYTVLNATFSRDKNEGISVALGLSIPVLLGFYLTGEAEYLYIQMSPQNQSNSDKVNIGGPSYNIGISFVF